MRRVESWLKALPPPVKSRLKRGSRLLDPAQRAVYRRRTGDRRPIPPAELRARVGAGLSIAAYVGTGWGFACQVDEALKAHGTSLADQGTVYDWGCGCGRLLMHLERYIGPDTSVVASDVDHEAVAWAARAFPRYRIVTNAFEPPLPVAEASVDCLISSSILTHLTEPDQDRWLAEVHRVLAPNGHAVISLAGPTLHRQAMEADGVSRSVDFTQRLKQLPSLDERGFQFVAYERRPGEERDFTGVTGTYGMTFHHPDYVENHWSRWLEVLDWRPGLVNAGQDLVLLRRTRS